MAPSPRATASSIFDQQWNETNAAFLDPTSLPVSKAPRAWERKTQVTKTRDGKQKKVFRRHTLRSREVNTTDVEEEDEEEHDSRSRAVKKLQRMSPDAMEKNAAMLKGKRRTFKATRWDRRKSVLPRKKVLSQDDSLLEMEETDENTLEGIVDSDHSALEHEIHGEEPKGPTLESLAGIEKSRETFGFAFDGQHNDLRNEDPPNVPEPSEDSRFMTSDSRVDDSNNLQFTFRSPTKAAPQFHRKVDEELGYDLVKKHEDAMESPFRSPHKQASPTKCLLFDEQTNPSPSIQRDTTMPLLSRSPASTAAGLTQSFRLRSSLGVERNGTIQLLFQSPGKEDSPTKRILLAEHEECSPTHHTVESDAVDNEVSEIVEQEHTVTFYEGCEIHVVTTTVVEEEDLHEATGVFEDQTITNRIESEKDTKLHAVSGVEHCQSPLLEKESPVASEPTGLDENQDIEMSGMTFDVDVFFSPHKISVCTEEQAGTDSAQEEDTLTEASLQLGIQRDIEMEEEQERTGEVVQPEEHRDLFEERSTSDENSDPEDIDASPYHKNDTLGLGGSSGPLADIMLDNIADGLTLSLSVPSSREPTPRRLRSPPPQATDPDDATMTIALDDDTAILKDFLTRVAANKANKVVTTARRESLRNRRDSDAIRHALASPRKILEDKDPNSPSKYDNDATIDLTQTIILKVDQQLPLSPTLDQADTESTEYSKSSRTSRRSSRTRKSRLPAPSSAPQPAQGPKSISVRRADGTEPIVLKKTEAQELGLLTRANTRKNKQGAFSVSVKLFSLNIEAAKLGTEATDDQKNSVKDAVSRKKNVRWDETLEYFQEATDTIANMKADAESLATPDELSLSIPKPSAKPKTKVPKDKNSTPKMRRTKTLGAASGTPGKGFLAPSSLLPDDLLDEKDTPAPAHVPKGLPKPKPSRSKKMPVASSAPAKVTAPPSLLPAPSSANVAPTTIEPAKDIVKISKERKSRLATPKRVKLPQSAAPVQAGGKENQQTRSIVAVTAKKGIPMPVAQASLPPPVAETGLPRRRARKM